MDNTALSYSFRPGLTRNIEAYTLTASALTTPGRTLPLLEVRSIRVYSIPGMRSTTGIVSQPQTRCVLHVQGHPAVKLSSATLVSFGRFDDHSDDFRRFVGGLVSASRSANPALPVFVGMQPGMWWLWMITFTALSLVCAVGVLGEIAVLAEQGFSLGLLGGLVMTGLMEVGAVQFIRATWRRRSRPAGVIPESLWADGQKAARGSRTSDPPALSV